MIVGGDVGASGDGRLVRVNQSGNVITLGDGATAIFAESIGGGGGKGGTGDIGLTGRIGVGGGGGAAGDGGTVDVDFSGDIDTSGDAAHGIFAQSVGGGGGIAGNIDRGFVETGIGLGIGQDGGSAGDGGIVTTGSSGTIVTRGSGAAGIFAQSVGGGGGVVGDLQNGLAFAGSAGGDGIGRDVIVTHSGSIFTWGDGSDGIFAQSIGPDGNGTITVNVTGGSVQGGSGSGAGIHVADGSDVTINNGGLLWALSGLAVLGTDGDDVINNTGILVGNVDLDGGNNVLNNLEPGLVKAGPSIDLGGGDFFNDGVLAFVDGSIGQESLITGNLYLQEPGTYRARINDVPDNDSISVTGELSLGGEIEISNTPGLYFDGTRWRVLEANNVVAGTAFDRETLPPPLPLRSFHIEVEPAAVDVLADVKPFRSLALNRVQRAVAGYFDRIAMEATGDVRQLLADVQGLADPLAIANQYSINSPRGAMQLSKISIQGIEQQGSNLEQRLRGIRRWSILMQSDKVARADADDLPPVGAAPPEWLHGLRIWAQPYGQGGDEDVEYGFTGYDWAGGGISFGADRQIRESGFVGLAGGWSKLSISQNGSLGEGDVSSWYASGYGTWYRGCAHVDAVLSGAWNDYSNTRRIDTPSGTSLANAQWSGSAFGTRVTAGCELPVGPIRAEPYFSLQYVYLDEDGYQEEGAGPIGMLVDDRTTNALFSDLGARFIKPIFLEQEWILTPEIVLGWVHDYDIDDRVIRAGFIGAPGTGFTVPAYQGNSHGFRAGAAFRVVGNGPVEASLEFDSRLRSHGYEMAGFLEFSVRF